MNNESEWDYVPNAETCAAIEECESGVELDTFDIDNIKDYVMNLLMDSSILVV